MTEPTAEPKSRSRRRGDTIPPAWVGTKEQFGWLEFFIKAILVMNVLDAILTIYWISDHKAVEANPLLAELAHQYPLSFVLVKLSLVSLGSALLWRLRRRPLAVIAIFAGFLGYYFLLIYHLKALNPRIIERIFGS